MRMMRSSDRPATLLPQIKRFIICVVNGDQQLIFVARTEILSSLTSQSMAESPVLCENNLEAEIPKHFEGKKYDGAP